MDIGHARFCATLIPGIEKKKGKRSGHLLFMGQNESNILKYLNREPEILSMLVKILTIK